MMYDITMNVVMPATVSRAGVVRCCANRKRFPNAERSNVSAKPDMPLSFAVAYGTGRC
jgi:hypothetical protein